MNTVSLRRQFIRLCLVFVLSVGIFAPAQAAPAHPSPQEMKLAASGLPPRTETLYFNGLQWGSIVGWNPYSYGMNNPLAVQPAGNSRVTVFETPYIYNMLDGKQYPLLADGAWSWNLAQSELTFKIKAAAQWSDGSPVTADDIAYTWASHVLYSTQTAEYYRDFIDTIEAPDPQTVVIKAKLNLSGKAVNPLMIAGYLSDQYVVQKAWTQTLESRAGGDADAFRNDPANDFVSSGPYTKYLQDDTKVILIRDDNYWGQDASMWGKLPAPKYLGHVIYASEQAGQTAFVNGEVDVSQQFIPNVQNLWLVDDLPISTYYSDAPYHLGASLPTAFYNLEAYGLDQVAIRKAIAIAVDYNKIITDSMTNQSATFTQVPRSLMNPSAPEQAMYDQGEVAALQWAGNDIAGAKALLDAAGIVDSDEDGWREYNGTKLSYVATCPNGWSDWQAAIEVLASVGPAIGIEITTNYPEWSEYSVHVTNSSEPLPAGYEIFMMWSDGTDITQPWGRIRRMMSSEVIGNPNNWNGNWGKYSNSAADALIQAIPGKTDPAELKADYTELTRIYLTDVPSFTLMYRPQSFHTVNSTFWSGFPNSDDGSNPPVPPLDMIDGYSIAGLYTLNDSPSVVSINRLDANPTSAATVRFRVTFSEPVTGVDATDFSLTAPGLTGSPAVTSVSGSNALYTVTVSTGTGSGSLRLNVSDNDSIRDLKSSRLGGLGIGNGSFSSGQSYIIRPPAAFGKTSPANGSSIKATSLTVQWAPSTNARSYEVCYDTSNDNACSLWVSTTTTSKLLSGLLPNATYYWQVRAKNATGIVVYANAGAYWSFRTDNTPPKVSAITRLDPNPTTAASVRFAVVFNETVSGVDLLDFKLVMNGLTGAKLTGLSGSGGSRIVTASTGTGTGTLQLQLIDNDSIKDAVNLPLGGAGAGNGSFLTGPKYTLDRNNQFVSSGPLDGWILESSETSGIGGAIQAAAATLWVGDDVLDKQYRALLSFNTAGIPDSATIVKVTLKIKKTAAAGTDPFSTHGALLAEIRKGFFGTSEALLPTDFQAPPTGAAGIFSPIPASPGWYQLVLNTANLARINKIGLTQFRLRFALDDNDDRGTDIAVFASGEASATLRPVLIVEYVLP